MSAEQTPDIEAVLAEHSIAGAVNPPQGAGQTIPELHILCLKCGWMSASNYGAHVAQALAPVLDAAVREARAAELREAADEWDACGCRPVCWHKLAARELRDRADHIAVDAPGGGA